jgi:hypothetical protein
MEDEAERHRPEDVDRFSRAVRDAVPDAHITWALSWGALTDATSRYRDLRQALRETADRHGDDVTIVPGGYFANAHASRDEVATEIAEGLERVAADFGRRPRSLVAGFLAAENVTRAAEEHGVATVQGHAWSQFDIDLQDGDGSIAYPYRPSRRHFLAPGRGDDTAPAVMLDGWTVDLLAARGRGGDAEGIGANSRLGLGPIETLHRLPRELALTELRGVSAAHFDAANVERNGLGWLTVNYELSEVDRGLERDPGILAAWSGWLAWLRETWPDCRVPAIAELGDDWGARHPDNDRLDYLLQQRGTGAPGSPSDEQVTWFMNEAFRLGIAERDGGAPVVFDHTDYDEVPEEPHGDDRRWSLLGRINQKGTRPQDRPVALGDHLAANPGLADELELRYGSRPELAALRARA